MFMGYRIKKSQIFNRLLPVPNHIRLDVYNSKLSFTDFITYNLEDKVPISCLDKRDREIVERFGLEKAKTLDWSLLEVFSREVGDIRVILLSLSPETDDLNDVLYKSLSQKLPPQDYSEGMKEKYPNRQIQINSSDNPEVENVKKAFNGGFIRLSEIIRYWDYFKDRDLTYILAHDRENLTKVTDKEFKEFMKEFKNTAGIIYNTRNIYELIRSINNNTSEEERLSILKTLSEEILAKTDNNKFNPLVLSNSQYKELFKYTSMKEYLCSFDTDSYQIEDIYRDLEYEGLTQEYILDSNVPLDLLKDYHVIHFIRTYGFKNILEFDKECGNFFTKDNCNMLKNMYRLYLHYAGNNHDPNTTFYTRKLTLDQEGKLQYRPYTKDEFYEAMKRMIIGGPTDADYVNSAPDYRQMTGEFKRRNASLFLESDAPEELKKLFYTKSLTPSIIRDNPEYIKHLKGKDLSSCFKSLKVKVKGSNTYLGYENLYTFLSRKVDYNEVINYIKEYSDVIDIIFDRSLLNDFDLKLEFEDNDTIDQIIDNFNTLLIRLLIEKNKAYPQNIPAELYKSHPEIFLSNDAPHELQKAFYGRTLTTAMLLDNPEYKPYLKGKDLRLISKYMPIRIVDSTKENSFYYPSYRSRNIIEIIEEEFKEDALQTLIDYGKYLEALYEKNSFNDFHLKENYDKEILLNSFDEALLNGIINDGLKYDERIAGHFKGNNPTLFLDDNVSQEIKDKFYNRKFTIEDFNNNPELIDIFNNTNIVCGFNENLSWLIPIINKENEKLNNLTRLIILTEYSKLQDVDLQTIFKEYIIKYKDNINTDNLSIICEVLTRLSMSNSSEMFNFRKELAHQILNTDNPIETLNKVESVFIRNNIPTVGKAYSCFEILHPDLKDIDMNSYTISPVLKDVSTKKRKYIIFNDLLKASFGSNNRSINKYISDIETGYKLYKRVKEENIKFNELDKTEQEILSKFRNIINTLYNQTYKGKILHDDSNITEDVLNDILLLEEKLNDGNGTKLPDRLIRMFCGGIGINTIEDAKKYVYLKTNEANKRNIQASLTDMELVPGDLIKGIIDIKYLRNILQNGSVSKEYLGSSASGDATPLDTDVSMIQTISGTTRQKIEATNANGYGPIWLVVKNNDRFNITRRNGEVINQEYEPGKLELFQTGVLGTDHYGIRTGFASTEIDYIVMDKYDTRVGLEIAMNGFYIPVADKDGKIVFTPKDYEELRSKMNGLTYFNEPNFVFSDKLVNQEVIAIASQIEESNREVKHKREVINKVIREALEEMNLTLKTKIDGDLTENYVELIDTGSTGRGTNKPGDGDFDFMMRLDRAIIQNPKKLQLLKKNILNKLGLAEGQGVISTGDFRIKGVTIEDITVDLDITFTTKTDSVLYSTEMSLQDRLETIKRQDEQKYNYVIANILQAKQVLKKAGAYKPNRGDNPEGGLGGVGIENWILQHGGSFYEAAKSFVEKAEKKSFEDFLHTYEIWDFGDNHLAEKRGKYPHDEFVSSNMSRDGFIKMTNALKEYLKEMDKNIIYRTDYHI